MSIDKTKYPALASPIFWEPVESRFAAGACADESMVSNISLIPTIGDKYVMMQLEDGRWELIGGTLEPGEAYMDGLERELMEEIGGELETFFLVGHFACHSAAEHPYRAHIPHPRFVRLIGTGEVTLVAPPTNPQDGEAVARVELMDIGEAVRLFRSQGRHDLAELYLFAHEWRGSGGRLCEAGISSM